MVKTKTISRGVQVGLSGGPVRDGKGMMDGGKTAAGTVKSMPSQNTVGGHGAGLFTPPKSGKRK